MRMGHDLCRLRNFKIRFQRITAKLGRRTRIQVFLILLAWRLSNTLDSRACVEALEEALARYGCPEIVNTDQGAQFTSAAFVGVLQAHDIRISMDGKGCYRDNIFVERLWRSVKYECLYLQAFDDGHAVHRELKRYFHWYNTERPHQGLDNQTPDELYYQHRQQVA